MSLTKSHFFNEINGLDEMPEQEIYERQMLQEQEAIASGEKIVVDKIKQAPNNEPVVDNRTDIQKIVGKGFDKKSSFRNVK